MPEPAIRREPRPDPAARPVERDGDAGDQRREGDPDEALARVALGDQQRELAEVGEPDRQVQALRDLGVAALEVDRRVQARSIGWPSAAVPTTWYGTTRTVPVPSAARRAGA